MKVKIKRLENYPSSWSLPEYATDGAACFDLRAVLDECDKEEGVYLTPHRREIFSTGLAFEVPEGYALMIYPRSSLGFKGGIRLSNSIGCLDSDFRGECKIALVRDDQYTANNNLFSVLLEDFPLDLKTYTINHGDRIAQAMIIPIPRIEWEEVEELTDTARGLNGFGSSGR